MDMGAIGAVITSLNTAAGMTKGFLDLKQEAALQGEVIKLQSTILSAQSSAITAQSDQYSLLETIRELKAKVAELEEVASERQRYALRDISGNGQFAYVLKKSQQNNEPIHALCAHCFQSNRKAILNWGGRGLDGETNWRCPNCNDVFTTRGPTIEGA